MVLDSTDVRNWMEVWPSLIWFEDTRVVEVVGISEEVIANDGDASSCEEASDSSGV